MGIKTKHKGCKQGQTSQLGSLW